MYRQNIGVFCFISACLLRWTAVLWLSLLMAFGTAIPALADNDSLTVLQIDDLYLQIFENHPVAKQIKLLPEDARQQLRMARGMFDPKIESTLGNKTFKDQNYYTHFLGQLKVPVWFGTDLKFGYEENTGVNLSPELDTDSGNGLIFAGISLPIGQGMMIDARRATLRQAEIFQQIAEAEQVKLLNKLILEVAKDYWQWYFHYHKYELSATGYELALFRFEAVKQLVLQGDVAPIDSVEAKITLQQRQINLRDALVEFQNARLILSNHVWGPDSEPLELPDTFIPVSISELDDDMALDNLKEFALKNHPELLKFTFKLEQLDIERKLAREMLKPRLDLNYNYLQQTVGGSEFSGALLSQNYKWGFDFAFPIFLRKERGKLAQTQIKLEQTDFGRLQAQREIINQVEAFYNEMLTMRVNLVQQAEMVDNYQTLLNGELQKFRNGTSTLFLVNVREGKLLESQIKLYDLRHKYAKVLAELRWAAGMGL